MQAVKQARQLIIVVVVFAFAAFVVSSGRTVGAAEAPTPLLSRHLTDQRQSTDDQYFVEFRSRAGYLFGHTYIVFGRFDLQGRPLEIRYAGLYPLDDQRGLVVGSIFPVPASVRRVEDDFKEKPTETYRRTLTGVQYAHLKAAVRYATATETYWQMVFANCNNFAIVIAKSLDLRAPPPWLLPVVFVAELRALNS